MILNEEDKSMDSTQKFDDMNKTSKDFILTNESKFSSEEIELNENI